MKKMDATFICTEQVKNEYIKNRSHAIREISDKSRIELRDELPLLLGNQDEKSQYKELIKDLKELLSNTNRKLDTKAKQNNLGADKIIKQIFKNSEFIKIDDNIVQRAHARFLRGFPPRKNKKDNLIGDAINWEALKTKADLFDDLIIISSDGDFASYINPSEAHEILQNEWESAYGEKLLLYKSLTSFLKEEAEEYFITLDSDRKEAVDLFVNSPAFAFTHAAIVNLTAFSHFDESDISAIVYALKENSQISWISDDVDVKRFYKNFYNNNSESMSNKHIAILKDFYSFVE